MRPRRALAALAIGTLAAAAPRAADERILDFRSEIAVAADASTTVRETITVRAEGSEINRGIYRDFPTRYRDALGNRVRVDFELVGARRDGEPEISRVESHGNGVRIYLGHENVLLELDVVGDLVGVDAAGVEPAGRGRRRRWLVEKRRAAPEIFRRASFFSATASRAPKVFVAGERSSGGAYSCDSL